MVWILFRWESSPCWSWDLVQIKVRQARGTLMMTQLLTRTMEWRCGLLISMGCRMEIKDQEDYSIITRGEDEFWAYWVQWECYRPYYGLCYRLVVPGRLILGPRSWTISAFIGRYVASNCVTSFESYGLRLTGLGVWKCFKETVYTGRRDTVLKIYF